MIYEFQLNRIAADIQCKIPSIAEKISDLLKKGKTKCAKEHIRNLAIVKAYYDEVINYNGFKKSVGTAKKIQVKKDNSYRVEITLKIGQYILTYNGSGKSKEILDYFEDQVLAKNWNVYRVSDDEMVIYTSCNRNVSFTLLKLDDYDFESSVSISDYLKQMSNVLDSINCLNSCELNCIICSAYNILNQYCNEC